MDKKSPLIIECEAGGAFCAVAIDSVVNGASSGGMRIAEDVSLDEIKTLAREMTLKYSFIGLPRGGAKSGVRMPAGLTGRERIAALETIGDRLAPVIRAGLYFPGMDMNCGPEELKAIYRGAGISLGEITDTSYFTAISVENAVYAAEKHLKTGQPLTVAIEGFGSVAAHLASRLPKERFRIKALSTIQGAIASDEGFDPEKLVALRKEHGDAFVKKAAIGRNMEKEEVLTFKADLLLPSARTRVITMENAKEIKARCIVPIANAPYTEDAIEYLHCRGVLCLPGFVANSGGVYASTLFDSGVSVEEIEAVSGEYYRKAVELLLARSSSLRQSPVRVAEEIALRRLSTNGSSKGLSGGILKKLYRKKMLPGALYGKVVLGKFVENLKSLEKEIESY